MSMTFRVTENSANTLMVNDLEANLARLQNLQQQVATGKQINQPSDNPGGTNQALGLRSQIGRTQQYAANITDGQGWMGAADGALTTVNQLLNQVQQIVLQGANGSSDTNARAALATQITTIKQSLLGQANTTYQDRPLFAGTFGTIPYANATNQPPDYTYYGSSQAMSRQVAPGEQVSVSIQGSQVFGSGATSVFALLDKISTDLSSSNVSALGTTDLSNVQAALNQATDAQGQVGARYAQLNTLSSQTASKLQSLQTSLGGIEDADMAQTVTSLTLQETAYQAALSTTAKVIQPSLADFLK